MDKQRIALDVMGGDGAPTSMLDGARQVVERGQVPAERVLLVGDEAVIRDGLGDAAGLGFGILHASQVIEMHESPGTALRKKPDSSISRCVGAVREGAAGAVVSMGNTGAVVGASTLGLGTLEGVRRPGIAVTLNLDGQPVTLIDMGANIAPKPEHLVQYAVMACTLMRDLLGAKSPRVGLLNIGEEESKGTDLLKATHEQLKALPQFIGNVEGADVFQGKAEVVVTDGFTGNVVLKLLEGFSAFMLNLVLGELSKHGVKWAPEALQHLRKNIDYAEYGGALLLGVKGTVVIGHGRSDANAVANALHLASRAIDRKVDEHIVQGLARAANPAG